MAVTGLGVRPYVACSTVRHQYTTTYSENVDNTPRPVSGDPHACREMKESLKTQQESADMNEPGQFLHTVTRAITSVRDCPCRIHSAATFLTLDNVGRALTGIVQKALWSAHPLDDPDPEEEESWSHLASARKSSQVCHP